MTQYKDISDFLTHDYISFLVFSIENNKDRYTIAQRKVAYAHGILYTFIFYDDFILQFINYTT